MNWTLELDLVNVNILFITVNFSHSLWAIEQKNLLSHCVFALEPLSGR